MATINKNELIKSVTNDCYDADEIADYLIRMRDAMARYFFAVHDMDFDKEECHSLYEFATELAEELKA